MPSLDPWSRGIEEEVNFWRAWLAGGGLEWPSDFEFRTSPSSRFQADLAELNTEKLSPYRVLDVGAGPLTVVGKGHPDFKVEITPVDILAKQYDALLASLDITPLVRTQPIAGETLAAALPDPFDLTFAHNTIDHTRDPLAVLRQMIQVTKVGGHIVLKHVRDVADAEDRAGLHQWNVSTAGRKLRIGGIDVLKELDGIEKVRFSSSVGWDTAILRRNAYA